MESWELHALACRYLMERCEELTDEYATSPDGDGAVPRYNVVAAMMVEVERLDPDHLPPPDALAAALAGAAENARSPFTEPPMGRVEADAIAEERRRFGSVVRTWMSGAAPAVEPVGYRRMLREEESADWRRRVESRWGVQELAWYPMLADPGPAEVLVLRATVHVGRPRGRHGPPGAAPPRPAPGGGAAGMWTDETLDWIAYASHEETVAFGGTVADQLSQIWADLGDWHWRGW